MDDFLTPYEVEHLAQTIDEIPIERFGSPEWFRQHETLDRLNIQAHKNAMNSTDEYVMESMVTFDKVSQRIILVQQISISIPQLTKTIACLDESANLWSTLHRGVEVESLPSPENSAIQDQLRAIIHDRKYSIFNKFWELSFSIFP